MVVVVVVVDVVVLDVVIIGDSISSGRILVIVVEVCTSSTGRSYLIISHLIESCAPGIAVH